MQAKTHSEELLAELSTSVAPVEDGARAAARRDRVVLHLAELVPTLPARREGQRRRRLVWTISVSSAAAIALVIGSMAMRSRPFAKSREPSSAVVALEGTVQVIHSAAKLVAPPLERIAVGNADEVVTGQGGRARASLASGAEVDIDPESKVRLSGGGDVPPGAAALPSVSNEAVVLGVGRVTVRVPKLGPSRSFAVETPEAIVVVHGTAFSVERVAGAAGEPPRTSVDVNEGTVAVRRHGIEVMLHAGDHWSSAPSRGSELDAAPSAEPRAPAVVNAAPIQPKATPVPTRGAGGASVKGSPDAPTSDKSTLAAENRLLQAAMAARQQGNSRRASELAGELVARYPASPLVEEARVERMRSLFAAGGPPAAEGEARAYLADYPRGFARQEAARILGSR